MFPQIAIISWSPKQWKIIGKNKYIDTFFKKLMIIKNNIIQVYSFSL